jgi:aryl-alcohol dehydrogenase-like predicted oxidoreductase
MVEQPQYNMFVREKLEDDLVPTTQALGFGLVTWSPLKFGLLSGKYNDGMPEGTRLSREPDWAKKVITEERVEKVRKLSAVAKDLNVSMPQLAIAWLLRVPEVTTVITGATRREHLKENLGAIEVVDKLTPDILDRIEEILT